MIDVVYPLANKSKGKADFEIRHSLRSLEAQDWVGRVFLVGHRPKWARNVVHIPCEDPFTAKDANIIRKVLAACESGVSDRFVVNSDDQYIMRPIGVDELGPYSDPSQIDHARAKSGSKWCARLLETLRWCEDHGYPAFALNSHIPYLVERDRYRDLFATIDWRGGMFTTHVYFNLALNDAPPMMPAGMALHPRGPMPRMPDLPLTFFNHNNAGLAGLAYDLLRETFPTPSRWEAETA